MPVKRLSFERGYTQLLVGLVVCLAVALWGKYRSGQVAGELDKLQHQIQFSQVGAVRPSAAVLESIRSANDALRERHLILDKQLFRKALADETTEDSTSAYFELASFVESLNQRLTSQGITINAGERYGFSQFEQQGPALPILSQVMRQQQAVAIVMDAFIESRPSSLSYVKRAFITEEKEASSALQRAAGSQTIGRTQLEDTFPKRDLWEGFNAYEVEVQFEGYSDSLRSFLKNVNNSEIPVLVSQLLVEPLDRYETPSPEAQPRVSANPFDAFAQEVEEEDGPVPIIRNNLSSFTIRFEVVLGEEVFGDA